LSGALRRMAIFFRTPYIAVTARLGTGTLEDRWHQGKSDPELWRPLVDDHLTDTFAAGKASCKLVGPAARQSHVGLLGVPLRDEWGQCFGAVALVISRCDQQSARVHLATLESLTGYLSLCVGRVGSTGGRPAGGYETNLEKLAASVGAGRKPQEIAFGITNRLRNNTGCDQVALGMPSHHRFRVVSVSGLDEIHSRSPGIKLVRSAMEECYDCDTPIVCPGAHVWAKSAGGAGFRLHWQWSQGVGSDSVASFPLKDGEECVAVISLRRRADRPLTESEVDEIRASVSHMGPALRLSRLATRSLGAHALEATRGGLRKALAPARRKWQIFGLVCAALAAWTIFGSMQYRLLVPCKLQAWSRQVITAPFDGVLVAQSAIAGESVSAGTVLCQLDDRDLLLRKRQSNAKLSTLETQKDEALARGERAKVQVIDAQQEEVRAELELIQWQLNRAPIIAPTDAAILAGDLREQMGAPVKAGQVLFEIAPPGQVFVELAVPEEEVDELSGRMTGTFATNARPEQPHPFHVSLVRPVAEIRNQRTVFVCEGSLTDGPSWLRPGMEGMATISVGRRPVWWVALHRMIDYVRMKVWF
jgi:hypothetical protein